MVSCSQNSSPAFVNLRVMNLTAFQEACLQLGIAHRGHENVELRFVNLYECAWGRVISGSYTAAGCACDGVSKAVQKLR